MTRHGCPPAQTVARSFTGEVLPRSDAPAGLRRASAWRAFPRSEVPALRGWGVLLDVRTHFLKRVAKVKGFFLRSNLGLVLDNIRYYFLMQKILPPPRRR